MSNSNKTYVIFDGDNDRWAYARMKGWNALKTVDFDFDDAHDEYPLTNKANDEDYIKSKLRKRFAKAGQVVVLIGKATKNLYKYVRWELEVAKELDLPIIAVNLNGERNQDDDLCPPIIKDEYVVHVSFKMKIIKHAMDNFPSSYKNRGQTRGARIYSNQVYNDLGLNE